MATTRNLRKNNSTATLGTTAFAKAFFASVPQQDLDACPAAQQQKIAAAVHALAAERGAGKAKISVFNPPQAKDSWGNAHTAIVVVNDDMPFIIDSLSTELTRQGLSIEALFHPILAVERGQGHKLLAARPAKTASAGEPLESMIYLQLEQLLSSDAAAALEKRLADILKQVRAATSDWKKMIAKAEDIIAAGNGWEKVHTAADADEARAFMQYVKDNNFTFLGYRQYKITARKKEFKAELVQGAGLGVLRDESSFLFGHDDATAEIRAFEKSSWPVVVVKLADHLSTVHRSVPMDAIAVKIVDSEGRISGVHLFVGLFTSSTYSCRTSEVPIVRQKVRRTIENAGFVRGSYDAKALEHILEKMPRDELFQVSTDDLMKLAHGALRLQTKSRIALFAHLDPLEQYMSCLVYVPRDRYNTKFRRAAEALVEKSVAGTVIGAFTTLDDSSYARMLFTIRLERKNGQVYNHANLEAELQALGREWDERLRDVLLPVFGKIKGMELAQRYGRAFTTAYHESIQIENAVHDIRQIEQIVGGAETILVDLYRLNDMPAGQMRLKVYHGETPVPLSDILPVLENMGLRSISEMPYRVAPQGTMPVYIHDFLIEAPVAADLAGIKANFEETFLQVWKGRVENDALNALAVTARLSWREVLMVRTYASFLRQARFPYSRVYVMQVLNSYPAIVAALAGLFKALHDPSGAAQAAKRVATLSAEIETHLQQVQKLDHDRILRSFRTLIEKTLRTNYFQTETGDVLAMKLDSKNIPDLPLPRPHVEIFVYSSRVEAVHLRGGEIARGGIRWSDRLDDFRTEILGLLKSQQVKNTVIVPVGAKGGFVVKQPPKTGGRDAFQQEGIECYKIFVQSLLDITDNNVKGKVVRPKNVVCHDSIDPYLVVAADKGTATFSDIANGLSQKAGFWLGDAFASGGATGYDHKKVGITARGGWECVKRHFREMGKDIQTTDFTVAGVGDMGGDVFGNAMLLSKHIKLVAAFNHVHIFIDPAPDVAKSFAERSRLFKARGGWDQYDKSLISAGGGVFERAAKSIRLTPQIKKLLGITADTLTPDELMNAILKAEVELMWFGGIGTYVKSSRQSHADADDKANDGVRVDGSEIRAKVLGEGANLGCTQLGRIEYARAGGRLNTDFIDNSAGVDCSDHEVNIKILLSDVVQAKKLTLPARNKLMEQMTEEVARLVLNDNYQQSQSLSVQEARVQGEMPLYAAFIRDLEKGGFIKRSLEGLPDDESLQRLMREGQGLTRPELSVLTSYAKMTIYNQILASDIPDDPAAEKLLYSYFPQALQKYKTEIGRHRLRREIIATQIVNILVNRMGPVFVASRMEKTGKTAVDVVRAFMVVMECYGLSGLWAKIEALDNKVPAAAQTAALNDIFTVVKRAVTWFLRFGGQRLDIMATIKAYGTGIAELGASILKIVPDDIRGGIAAEGGALAGTGLPAAIAADIGVLKLLSSASDIVALSRKAKVKTSIAAAVYFDIGARLELNWLRGTLEGLVVGSSWQARVRGGLMDDFYAYQAQITAAALQKLAGKSGNATKHLEAWLAGYADVIAQLSEMTQSIRHQKKVELEMLVLCGQRIGQLVQAMNV